MSTLYNLVLTGQVLPGRTVAQVAPNLSQVMRIPEAQAHNLLCGMETIIKRRITPEQVPRYLQALGRAGVEARADEIASEPHIHHGGRPKIPATNPLSVSPYPGAGQRPASPYGQHNPSILYSSSTTASLAMDRAPMQLSMVEEPVRQPEPSRVAAASVPNPQSGHRISRAEAGSRHAIASAEEATPPAFGFSMAGRIGRLRYMAYAFPAYVPLIIGAVLMLKGPVFMIAGLVVTLIMMVRLIVLRLHDLNLSGAWVLLPGAAGMLSINGTATGILLSSVITALGALAIMLLPGSREENDYGPPPGPNSGLVLVGAAIFLALVIASGASNPSRQFKNWNKPTPEQVEEED